jgi:hypothetical protein
MGHLPDLPADEDDPAAVEAAWAEELQRRMEEIDSGAAVMIPAEQVMAEFWARRRRRADPEA